MRHPSRRHRVREPSLRIAQAGRIFEVVRPSVELADGAELLCACGLRAAGLLTAPGAKPS